MWWKVCPFFNRLVPDQNLFMNLKNKFCVFQLHSLVESIGNECRVSKIKDRCEAAYDFIMCLERVIHDNGDTFENLIDYDMY